jgi:hypothetical protein
MFFIICSIYLVLYLSDLYPVYHDNIDIDCVLSHDIDIYDVITMWMFDINNNEWKNQKN